MLHYWRILRNCKKTIAAKSLQSCPTLWPHPWDSPGKNTGVACHFLLQFIKVKSQSEVAQSCLTLRDPMDCSLPGSSVHGIFQARVLGWGGRWSQDGGGIERGDHFLPYKFIERTTERRANFTKQLLIASWGHQAPRKGVHCLWKEVGQNIKDKKRDKRARDGDPSWEGSLSRGSFQTPRNPHNGRSGGSFWISEGNLTGKGKIRVLEWGAIAFSEKTVNEILILILSPKHPSKCQATISRTSKEEQKNLFAHLCI